MPTRVYPVQSLVMAVGLIVLLLTPGQEWPVRHPMTYSVGMLIGLSLGIFIGQRLASTDPIRTKPRQ